MMMVMFPDPKDSKLRDSLGLLIVSIIAFIVLLLTLPGCQSDDQKQKYQPYVAPPAPAVDRIRPAVHEAATRVDDVLEQTPVPLVAEPDVEQPFDEVTVEESSGILLLIIISGLEFRVLAHMILLCVGKISLIASRAALRE